MRSRTACHNSLKKSKRLAIPMAVFFSVLLFSTQNIYAQTATTQLGVRTPVKGRVTGEDGKPLEGVSVQLKGSSIGTLTNANGEFQLNTNSNNAVLFISFVGMEPQELAIGSKQEINVSLTPAAVQQQEVVVVGYGTQKKQAVTGAVATAKLKTYENVAENNIIETVKGALPGLD